jgi:hypothetical protein
MQREEKLHLKAIALQKATDIESGGALLEATNKELGEARAQYPKAEYALYRVESMLPWDFKQDYDSLRRNTAWFMREEMVQDCSDQGGCCSRECGCCTRRHLSQRKKGRGHCTFECWCCISFRGFELPEKEKKEIREDFKRRLEPWISYNLINWANRFFGSLKPQGLSNPKSRWQQFLGGSLLRRKIHEE